MADEYIIKVKAQDGTETVFKIRSTTKMERIFKTYCERKGIALGSTRFLFNGKRIDGNKTPFESGIESGDFIDLMLEQTGGFQMNLMIQLHH